MGFDYFYGFMGGVGQLSFRCPLLAVERTWISRA